MHSAIFIGIGLILLGSMSISQCRRAFKEESDEMVLGERHFGRREQRYRYDRVLDERNFDPVARRAQRYDYETLRKRLNFGRRDSDKQPCVEIKKNGDNYATGTSSNWANDQPLVRQCMADCDKEPSCIGWVLHIKSLMCYLKSDKVFEHKPTHGYSGWCDSTQLPNIIGIGTNLQLYTRATLTGTWAQIDNSGNVIAITMLPDGTLLGVGTDYSLWTRATLLTSSWVQVPNSGLVIAVTVLPDGTILGVGKDYYLWTRATLTSSWVQVPNSGDVIAVAVLPDGTILGVGKDYGLWTRATLTSSWVQVPNSGDVIAVTVLADGTIVGVGKDYGLWTRATLTSNWVQIANSGKVIGVAALNTYY